MHDPAEVVYECAYLLPWKDHLVARLETDGVPCHCLQGGRSWDLRWTWRLRRLLLPGGFDVVQFHSPYVAMIGRLVAWSLPRGARPRLVTTEHNVWRSFRWPTRLLNALTAPLDDARAAV